MRVAPHREHIIHRHAVLMLSYRIEGTSLSAVARPVFLLWTLASKVCRTVSSVCLSLDVSESFTLITSRCHQVLQSFLRRFLADYVRNIILMRVGVQASRGPRPNLRVALLLLLPCTLYSMICRITRLQKHAKRHEHDAESAETGSQHIDITLEDECLQSTPSQHAQGVAVAAAKSEAHGRDAASAADILTDTRVAPPDNIIGAATAAAITARLQAEYSRPSRYTSNIFFDADSRSSVQKNIHLLLRGSSSSVALSNRARHSPFVDTVARVPRPPSSVKLGSASAQAHRKLSMPLGGGGANNGLDPAPAFIGTGKIEGKGRASGGSQVRGHTPLFPPLNHNKA